MSHQVDLNGYFLGKPHVGPVRSKEPGHLLAQGKESFPGHRQRF
ncbi:MAG: hypothetical protein M0005_08320 [Actinomycetota bacterium]|nr:hypothetical protein [Actinomycetota bacterium]